MVGLFRVPKKRKRIEPQFRLASRIGYTSVVPREGLPVLSERLLL